LLSHDPKDWWRAIVRFQRSDTLRRLLPWIVVLCLYTWFIAWLEIVHWRLGADTPLRNINIMHTILGVVMSFLLVFRTNTAYDRWWEARRQWGNLTNGSRNLAMKLAAILPASEEKERAFFRSMIPAFAETLKDRLREEASRVELFDDLAPAYRVQIDESKHLPSQVARILIERVFALEQLGVIKPHHLITLNLELSCFAEVSGACERIKNTPIPYSYSAFIKKFILIYVLTLPLGFAFSLGYLCIPVVGFIFYVLASLELIAEEIEDPFGSDENDLPLNRMVQSLRTHMGELI
jgi:ion channel-forming bestrophin family protein